ncbi:MAG TPA: carbohydrate ABC transporter permease [Candidatus Methylomirabilis sp.]|nr:carbohydrate ABC transporter permease [Candidatus Methylomirabilis sp.]
MRPAPGRRSQSALHGVLLLAGALVLFPFLWIALAAFKTQIALMSGLVLFTPVLSNFQEVLFSRTSEYLGNFVNSTIIGIGSTAGVLLVGTLGAWSLRRMRWPAWVSHGLLAWAIVFQMIPPITMVGAWYVMFRTVGLYNTYPGLMLAHLTLNLPLVLWMMSIFVGQMPEELEEAARIDGAGTPVLLWRVVVPVIRPGLVACGLLVFILSWNEFAVALNLTAKQTATVPVAIAKYAQEFEIQYTQMAASAVLSIVPALLLLLIGERHIVRGLTAGAIK